MGEEAVTEEDDRAENSEELPGGGDDGAGEGSELGDAHEDEELSESAGHGEGGEVPDDGRVSLDEADELQALPGGEDGDGEVAAAPLVHGQHHVTRLGPVLQLHPLLESPGQPVAGEADQQQQLPDTEQRVPASRLLGVLLVHEHGHAGH